MPKMIKKLAPAEIDYGYLYHSKLSKHFPIPSQPITIIDSDGKRFVAKRHSRQSRIDRLTSLYRKHRLQSGQTVTIEIKSDKAATAYFAVEQLRINSKRSPGALTNTSSGLFQEGHLSRTGRGRYKITATGRELIRPATADAKFSDRDEAARAKRSGQGFGSPEENRRVERAAVKVVRNHFITKGWHVKSTERDRIGYDLKCIRSRQHLHVEVKGIRGSEPTFFLTADEYHRALSDSRFRLALVRDALGTPKIDLYSGEEIQEKFSMIPLLYRLIVK